MTSYLEHPLLKPESVERRLFQMDLAARALRRSSLVVLPTGLGKTVVALMVLLARLGRGKVLFLAPTRPLVEQHANFLKNVLLDPESVVQVTGETDPERRMQLWREARIIAATPQVIENDLLSRRIELQDVSLIIFDEAHRGVGNYAYVYIASRYQKEGKAQLVLGITASPGSQGEKIGEICANLGMEAIETKTEEDPDVAPFIHHREIEWVRVVIPDEILRLRKTIEDVLEDRIEDLNSLGAAELAYGSLTHSRVDPRASKRELLELQQGMSSAVARRPNPALYKGLSILAEVMKLKHAVELAETQGVDALARYFSRLEGEARSRGGSKASRRLVEDPRIQEVVARLATMEIEHPKLARVQEILSEQLEHNPQSLIMVFTNYRDTATALLKFLKSRSDGTIRPVRFVGQSSRQGDEGLSQKKQARVLDRFRSGEHNVLIATSVGEEGIDIPATDMVLFYEPVPSEIRSIQRKGRTGRARAGRVVVLIARGTRDEAYYWISDRKEKSMQKQIRGGLKIPPAPDPSSGDREVDQDALGEREETAKEADLADRFPGREGQGVPEGEGGAEGQESLEGLEGRPQSGNSSPRAAAARSSEGGSEGGDWPGRQARFDDLNLAEPSSPMVFVDPRERDMGRRLEALGVRITLHPLEVGDYVLSDRLGIERKTAEDFVSSIVNPERELFRQIGDLARSYERPLLILEGQDLYSRQVHPNAIRGALSSIAVDFGVPVLPTRDLEETAATIALLARREQQPGGSGEIKAHGRKTARTLKEQQEYLITAIPSVGPAVARNLLRHFGSVEAVMKASYEELMEVDLVGPRIAERIRELVGGEYKG
ncbi:MAG: DEAD/DEAH box helicase [Methanosarcinales archaeon]|nr:DEAD/DEAH box helicase [Methanosarcinales archaeon]